MLYDHARQSTPSRCRGARHCPLRPPLALAPATWHRVGWAGMHGTDGTSDGTGRTEPVPSARVTVAEAAAHLGVTVVTVRRMIKRGELEAERVLRPQGSACLVTLPPLPVHGTEDGTVTEPPAQNVSRTQGTATELMAAWSTAVLAPLVAELAVSRQRIEDLSAQVGELRAENRVLAARTEARSVEPTTEAPTARPASTTWLTPRRFWLIAALVLVLIGVGVVQVGVALYSLAVQVAMPG